MENLRDLQKRLQDCEQKVKALSLREKSLSDFIENASVPLHWVNNEGIIIWANKAELDFLGYTHEEYIGRLISDFHADSEVIDDMLTRLKNGETLKNHRAQLVRKDGTIKHVIINSNVLFKEGKFIHTRCFTRDITELIEEELRKSEILKELEARNKLIKEQAEEWKKDREMLYSSRQEIEEAELRARLAIKSTKMGTFDWDLKNLQFLYSERVLEIFGLKGKKNVTHQDLLNTFHPADKPLRDKAVADSLNNGLLEYEARIIWPDKSIHWMKVYGNIIYNDGNEPVRMYGMVTNITEQKEILEELQEREAKFRLLADSMPQQIWTSDAEGNLDYFNKAVYDLSGLSFEHIQKNGWIDVVHPDDRAENIAKWMHSITTGEEFIFEHRFKNHSGDYRWQLSRALPQKDSSGTIQRWVGTSTDIHDQKNATAALEQKVFERTQQLNESKAFLQSVLNTTKNIIASYEAMKDEDGRIFDFKIIYCNDELTHIIGLKPEDIVGKTCKEIYPNIFNNGIFERLVQCVITGVPDNYEAQYNHNNVPIWFEASLIKLNDTSITLTSKNITEEKNAEIQLESLNKKLAFQNELFTHAEESSRQGNYSWNLDTAESTYSDNFFKLLGYQPGEFTALKDQFKNHIHPDDLDFVMKEIQKVLESQRVNEWQFRMITCNGQVFHTKSTGAIMTSSGERLLVGTIQDITKEKMTALQLEQMNLELERQNAELASFSYIASHDLQEPLRKITTFSSRLQEKHKIHMPDDAQLYLDKIEDSAIRMSKLIRDLLDYSRLINHEKLFAQTDLNAVLKNVLTDFELLIDQKRAEINWGKLLVIEAIPLHMNQLFYNLLSNALKFSRENVPPVITITSRLLSKEEIKNHDLKAQLAYCEITVKDNGIGFEQKYDQQIFVIFQRLNQRHQYDGTGIGLALCKKIMDNHYGKISVQSSVNEGSTFHIILPISQPA